MLYFIQIVLSPCIQPEVVFDNNFMWIPQILCQTADEAWRKRSLGLEEKLRPFGNDRARHQRAWGLRWWWWVIQQRLLCSLPRTRTGAERLL